jgi:hypothetical protein
VIITKSLIFYLRLGQLFALLLLFGSVITSPVFESGWWGLIGAESVGRYSVLLLLLTGLMCWVPDRSLPDGTVPNHPAWVEFIFACLFVIAIQSFVAGSRDVASWGIVTGHDQPQYFAYLHSWVFDHDLNFENEYESISGNAQLMSIAHSGDNNYNVAPIGAPVLWLPFYLVTHSVLVFLSIFGVDIGTDGLSTPYAIGVAFGGIVMALCGLVLIYSVLTRWFSKRSSMCTCFLIWYATPLQWYLLDEAWMSHASSFFAGALVLFLFFQSLEQYRLGDYCLLGLAIGIAMLVRPSHGVLILLPCLICVSRVWKNQDFKSEGFKLIVSLVCIVIAFSPQLITWYLRTGFEGPPGSPMQWSSPALSQILFSSQHGLIAWHPITLFGFIGVPFLWKRSRICVVMLFLVIGLNVYINASISSWWGGTSFGMRRFIGILPFFSLGIAALGSWSVRRFQQYPIVPVGILLTGIVFFNSALLTQFRQHWFAPTKSVSFGTVWTGMAIRTHRDYGNPFSFPASAQFASKYQVTPGQYDLLGSDYAELDSFSVKGPFVNEYVGEGWDTDTKYTYTIGGKAIEKRCTLVLPLRDSRNYKLTMDMKIPNFLDGPQKMKISLNGDELGVATLELGQTATINIGIAKKSIYEGLNHLELNFERVAIESIGGHGLRLNNGLTVDTVKLSNICAYLNGLSLTPID